MKRGGFARRLKAAWLAPMVASALLPATLPGQDTTAIGWAAARVKPRIADSTQSLAIHYPELLRDASVGGEVLAALVIDEHGSPDTTQFEVERTSHSLFTDALRLAVARWRFVPGSNDSGPVRVRVPLHAVFAPPARHEVPLRESWQLREDSTGLNVAVAWEPIAREVTIARDTADLKWAKLQVFLTLLASNPGAYDTLAAVCLRWGERGTVVPASIIRRVRLYYPDAVNADVCPPTYAPQIRRVDSTGTAAGRRPKGHVDPIWIRIGTVQPWTADLWVISASTQIGTVGSTYYCESARDERGRWSARCELRAQYVY